MEGAGYGGGGHGEDIDGLAEAFEAFLVFDAEALFFVDDDEAEVLEADIGAEDAVGADEDVEAAGGEALEGLADLAGRFEAAEDVNDEGEVGEAFGEGAIVLFGEDGGGDEDGDLFSGFDGFEGSAEGEFGFAVADVAAEEAVQGAGLLHIEFDVSGGGDLVVGVGVGEGLFEFALPGGVWGEGEAWDGLAVGLEFEEIGGEVLDGVGDFVFLFLPGGGAEACERGAAGAGADVLVDEVDFRGGEMEEGLVGEFEGEEFLVAVVVGDGFEAAEAGDAVLDVDDQVAGFEVGEGFDGLDVLEGA